MIFDIILFFIAIVFVISCVIALVPSIYQEYLELQDELQRRKEENAKTKARECEGGCLLKKSYTCACDGDCIEGIDKKYACPCWESCAECCYLMTKVQ